MTNEPNPLRRILADLEPWQRGVLSVLAGAVSVTAVVLAVAAVLADPREASGPRPSPAAATADTTPSSPATAEPSTTTSPTSTVPTTTAPTTSSSSTTSTTSVTESLTLRPDGVGDIYFGTGADATLDSVSAILGPPSSDTGWLDPTQVPSACAGVVIRFVDWGSLQVFLTEGPTDWAPAGTRHFAAYAHSPQVGEPVWDLRTGRGLGVGTSVGDLRALYGEVAVSTDPLFGPFFEIDVPGAGYLWGEITGVDATDTVKSISGGRSCAE